MDIQHTDCVLATLSKGGAEIVRQQKHLGNGKGECPHVFTVLTRALFALDPGDEIRPRLGHEVIVSVLCDEKEDPLMNPVP